MHVGVVAKKLLKKLRREIGLSKKTSFIFLGPFYASLYYQRLQITIFFSTKIPKSILSDGER